MLFGENGAGKSTLISILAGVTAPTAGTVAISGEGVTTFSVRHARALGVSAVFQEFSLVPTQTVVENLLLGDEPARGAFLNRREGRRRARALFEALDCDIDLDADGVAPVARPAADRRDRQGDARSRCAVLILDEPTASLTDRETRHPVRPRRPPQGARHRHRLHLPPHPRVRAHRRPHHRAARRAPLRHRAGQGADRGAADRDDDRAGARRDLPRDRAAGRRRGPARRGPEASGVGGASFAIRAGEVDGLRRPRRLGQVAGLARRDGAQPDAVGPRDDRGPRHDGRKHRRR